jgi:hypothetical protein
MTNAFPKKRFYNFWKTSYYWKHLCPHVIYWTNTRNESEDTNKVSFWNLSQSEKSVKIPCFSIKIISRLDFANPIHLPCSVIKLHQIWHIYLQMRIMSSNWAAFTSNPLGVAQIFLLILKKRCQKQKSI